MEVLDTIIRLVCVLAMLQLQQVCEEYHCSIWDALEMNNFCYKTLATYMKLDDFDIWMTQVTLKWL